MCFVMSLILALSARFSKNYDEKYGQLDGKKLSIEGHVEDITYKKKDDSKMMVIYLEEGVICYMLSTREPKIGSKVNIRGSVFCFENARNPGQFDSGEYYEIIGIKYGIYGAYLESESKDYSVIRDALYHLRRSCSSKLDEALPENEAAVMKTMLLGEKSELDSEMKELYQRNGIAHILCISGLHISLLGMGLFKILRKCRMMPVPSALLSSIPVFLYGVMTGFGVSAVRAIFMFCMSMAAVLVGRTYDMVTAVSVAALLILAYQPLYIYHSGFVFSFGCIAGIAFLMPTLTSNDVSEKPNWLLKSILSSGCMMVIGMPIYYWFYFQIPVYSSILNFMVIPTMSILVPCGIFLIMAMYIHPGAASVIRAIIVGILRFFDILAKWADEMPFHYLTPGRPELWQVIMYIIVMGAVVFFRKRLKMWLRWVIVLVAMLLLTLRFRPDFETCFIDVGQGDGILVRSFDINLVLPGLGAEHAILVDGGSSDEKEVGKYRIIPFLKYKGVGCLEAVVVTHPDEDHMNGVLELLNEGRLEGIEIKELIFADTIENRDSASNAGIEALSEAAKKEGIRIAFIGRGDEFMLGDAVVKCLSPRPKTSFKDLNESSVVLKITHGIYSELLTGDVQGYAENEMIRQLEEYETGCGEITLLKCAHHGSRNSTPESLLEIVKPKVSVISCGEGNSYGHPHKETLKRLDDVGSLVLRTDRTGEIEINKKGDEIKVKTFIPPPYD